MCRRRGSKRESVWYQMNAGNCCGAEAGNPMCQKNCCKMPPRPRLTPSWAPAFLHFSPAPSRGNERDHARTQDECPSRFKLWGQHCTAADSLQVLCWKAHAMLHASAAPAPCCLKNCDQDAAGQKLGIYPKGVWFGKGPGPAARKGRVRSAGRPASRKEG